MLTLHIVKFLSRRIKAEIKLSKIRCGYKGLIIYDFILTKPSLEVHINLCHVTLRLKKTGWIGLNMTDVKIIWNRSDKNSESKRPKSGKATSHFDNAYYQLRKLFQAVNKSIHQHCVISVNNIDINKDHKNILSIQRLSWKRSRTHMVITSKLLGSAIYDVRFHVKPEELNYVLNLRNADKHTIFKVEKSTGKVTLNKQSLIINSYIRRTTLNHEVISTVPLQIEQIKSNIKIAIKKSRLTISDQSLIQLNSIFIRPYIKYNLNDPDLIAATIASEFKPEALITIIPELKCTDLTAFESSGSIGVSILLAFLRSDPYSYKFDLEYDTDGFEVINPGVNFDYLKQKFTFYRNHKGEHRIEVHSDASHNNLANTPTGKTILFTEDPNFYYHKGFDPYFLGRALVINIANRQFLKGASTITMQMVKNLYLDHKKNLIRKVEEIILTLLIENHFKIQKERILEIYLQIIELGPDIYGVSDGAQFYFGKNVRELSVQEGIVLSYIIPRPNFFLEAVQLKSEQLNRNLSKHVEIYFPIMAEKIEKHNKITLVQTIKFRKEIGSIHLSYLHL